ncbi:MAG TPA: hypothetical protein PKW66_05505, partial [Polyangiaceae bacterium]|nr:hypothetical protein [Polyangiaceae bacterium]
LHCSTMSQGVRAYHSGLHTRAMSYWLEMQEGDWARSPHSRARYALYRGLTHLSLGDEESAQRWLAEAKDVTDRQQGVLDDEDMGRLLVAWRVIGHEPGTWGRDVLESR